MPQMGESIVEGTITKWLKKPGDRVEKDEPLFEISTDKVDAEIPSPIAGMLSEIKVPEGATVEINTVVAVIGGSAPSEPAPCRSAKQRPRTPPLKLSQQQSRCLRSTVAVLSVPRLSSAASPKKTKSTSARSPALVLQPESPKTISSAISARKALIDRHKNQFETPPQCKCHQGAAASYWRPRTHDQNARHYRPAHG